MTYLNIFVIMGQENIDKKAFKILLVIQLKVDHDDGQMLL